MGFTLPAGKRGGGNPEDREERLCSPNPVTQDGLCQPHRRPEPLESGFPRMSPTLSPGRPGASCPPGPRALLPAEGTGVSGCEAVTRGHG